MAELDGNDNRNKYMSSSRWRDDDWD